jgi:hypothetical protein
LKKINQKSIEMRLRLLIILLFSIQLGAHSENGISVIPRPNVIQSIPGSLLISDSMAIKIIGDDERIIGIAEEFLTEFAKFTGMKAFLAGKNYSGNRWLWVMKVIS